MVMAYSRDLLRRRIVNLYKDYQLTQKLNELTDSRQQSYVEYQISVLTVTRLLGILCGMKSMRETTEKLNTEDTIKNINALLGTFRANTTL